MPSLLAASLKAYDRGGFRGGWQDSTPSVLAAARYQDVTGNFVGYHFMARWGRELFAWLDIAIFLVIVFLLTWEIWLG